MIQLVKAIIEQSREKKKEKKRIRRGR